MILYLLLCMLLANHFVNLSPVKRSFTIDYKNDQFLKDGKAFRYISAGIHYFRVPQYYWQDRLYKIKKAGINAIQTYIAWNVHEPFRGDYRFTGDNDLVKFIKLAQQNDLLVILRPGPYICAEWEYGGFPYWIMKEVAPNELRTHSQTYLKVVDRWMSVLLTLLKPLLYSNGGPIISVQVENEYGSYGSDHVYMKTLGDMFRKYLGNDVVLFTTDGAGDYFLKGGAVPSLYTTIDFGAGGDPSKTFKVQRKWQPHGPLVNSEYYTGWLDHWGEGHSRTDGKLVAHSLDQMLAINASVNMYMFEGGTNFAFWNGANQGRKFQPQPTSYDYDAPLSEAGDPTYKYFLIQKVIAKYNTIPPGPNPKPTKKASYGKVHARKTVSLFKLIPHLKSIRSVQPLSFEAIDLPYGYILYRSWNTGRSGEKGVLKISKLHDRAVIFVDQVFQGILDRNYNNTIHVTIGRTLDILVENQGRVNYGGYMRDTAKGILSEVTLNGYTINNWEMFPINETTLLDNMDIVLANPLLTSEHSNMVKTTSPSLTYFTFKTAVPCDTFLKLDAWTKGIAILNDFNLGRYWTPSGPQRTLYVPKHILKETNTLVLFETDHMPSIENATVEFVDQPVWTSFVKVETP